MRSVPPAETVEVSRIEDRSPGGLRSTYRLACRIEFFVFTAIWAGVLGAFVAYRRSERHKRTALLTELAESYHLDLSFEGKEPMLEGTVDGLPLRVRYYPDSR